MPLPLGMISILPDSLDIVALLNTGSPEDTNCDADNNEPAGSEMAAASAATVDEARMAMDFGSDRHLRSQAVAELLIWVASFVPGFCDAGDTV